MTTGNPENAELGLKKGFKKGIDFHDQCGRSIRGLSYVLGGVCISGTYEDESPERQEPKAWIEQHPAPFLLKHISSCEKKPDPQTSFRYASDIFIASIPLNPHWQVEKEAREARKGVGTLG